MRSLVVTLKQNEKKQTVLLSIYIFVAYTLIVVSYLMMRGVININATTIIVLLVLFFVWFIVLNFTLFLQKYKVNIVCFVAIFGLLIVLFLRSVDVFIALCIFALGYWIMLHRAKGDKVLFTKFSPIRSLRHCVPWCVLGMSIFMSTALVSYVIVQESTSENPIPRQVFDTLFIPVDEILNIAISEYDADLSPEQVRDLLIQNFANEEWIDNNLSFLQDELPEQLPDIPEPPDQQTVQSFKDSVYEFVNESVQTPLLVLSAFVSVFAGVALFVLFQVLFIVLMLISFYITWLAIKVCMRYGIILIYEQNAKRQSIKFSS